jgi:hypothetical protein
MVSAVGQSIDKQTNKRKTNQTTKKQHQQKGQKKFDAPMIFVNE